MKVLVYGLGRSGMAVARLLSRQGHSVVAFDKAPREGDLQEIKRLGAVMTHEPSKQKVDLCIAAPGVPYNHKDLISLRDSGIETIGEVEWVYRSIDASIIGITGTAGKTTVTRWLSNLLQASGIHALAGGNIDPALSAVAQKADTLVCELSSFQLERCPNLRPKLAIALNLGVDHIDRHGSLDAYHRAKKAIIANQKPEDLFIYNADDPILTSWANHANAKTKAFSTSKKADAYLMDHNGETFIMLGQNRLMTVDQLSLSANHQVSNALAVALAAQELGVSLAVIKQELKGFKGVPGRFSVVKTLGDISFIEDSIATRSMAVKAALDASSAPIVWIAGGEDKGADFEDLAAVVKDKVALFVGIGKSGPDFAKKLSHLTSIELCSQTDGLEAMHCACKKGLDYLQNNHNGKGSVLLAPMAASFDQFKDYKARAQGFRDIVNRLEATWIPS